jgi:hypothetical protein
VRYLTFCGDHFDDNPSAFWSINCRWRSIWQSGAAMSPVSVLKTKAVGPKAIDRETRRQDDAACELISLLSFLEADNKRLWQTVVELSLETLALRQALKKIERRRRVAAAGPKKRPSSRSGVTASATPAQAAKVARLVLASGC